MPALQPRAKAEGVSLRSLLDVALRTRPDQVLMRAPARREIWAGEPGRDVTARTLDEDSHRLAGLLAMSRLPARARAMILCPLGPEAMTAMLAALIASYRPCFLPLSAPQPRLQSWIDGSGPSLALGMSKVGDIEPARMLRDCAARSFNARLVCAFGSPAPDGVVPLSDVFAGPARRFGEVDPAREALEPVALSAETSWGDSQSFSENALADAAVDLARVAKMGPHGRILTMMTGVTGASLASGPYLALLTGAELLPLGLFSLSALWAGLSDGKPVCLVAPEALEPMLIDAGIIGHQSVASVVFLHRTLPEKGLRAREKGLRMIDLVPTPNGGWVAVERST